MKCLEREKREQKDSKNYEKQRIKLAKAYERLENQRDDFLHKLSRFYVDNYDVICVENLNIKMRGWDDPNVPAEMKPLLVTIPASLIAETGSPFHREG